MGSLLLNNLLELRAALVELGGEGAGGASSAAAEQRRTKKRNLLRRVQSLMSDSASSQFTPELSEGDLMG